MLHSAWRLRGKDDQGGTYVGFRVSGFGFRVRVPGLGFRGLEYKLSCLTHKFEPHS